MAGRIGNGIVVKFVLREFVCLGDGVMVRGKVLAGN